MTQLARERRKSLDAIIIEREREREREKKKGSNRVGIVRGNLTIDSEIQLCLFMQ
jgi:hypothetical protein